MSHWQQQLQLGRPALCEKASRAQQMLRCLKEGHLARDCSSMCGRCVNGLHHRKTSSAECSIGLKLSSMDSVIPATKVDYLTQQIPYVRSPPNGHLCNPNKLANWHSRLTNWE
uniref:Uncharacterized protein n=1 Tax=Ditylenchus dipsaci TaxID=166011 RepID=A0A915ETI2_9BILA